MNLLLFFIFLNLCFLFHFVNGENSCGDWEPYKEKKCFRVIDNANTQSFADAEKTCATYDSKLITIGSNNEQAFLENYLFTKKAIVDNVWLGGKNNSVSSHRLVYRWQDGSNLTFTNWENGYPKDRPVDTCIQMNSDKEVWGKWSNEPCARKNLVVCEKEQTWSLKKIQTLLVQTMQNLVPLGFIYVQLPGEAAPENIFHASEFKWTDISETYKGVFFRVVGDGSAPFGAGVVQPQAAPHLDQVVNHWCYIGKNGGCNFYDFNDNVSKEVREAIKLNESGWADYPVWLSRRNIVEMGNRTGEYLEFHNSGGEVRPRNVAVKVWKRTG